MGGCLNIGRCQMRYLHNHDNKGLLSTLGVLMLLPLLFSGCSGDVIYITETSTTTLFTQEMPDNSSNLETPTKLSTIILHEERHAYPSKTVQLEGGEASFELLPGHRCSVVFYVDTMEGGSIGVNYACFPTDMMNSIWVEISRPAPSEYHAGVILSYNQPNFGIIRASTGWYAVDFFYDELIDPSPTVEIYIKVDN